MGMGLIFYHDTKGLQRADYKEWQSKLELALEARGCEDIEVHTYTSRPARIHLPYRGQLDGVKEVLSKFPQIGEIGEYTTRGRMKEIDELAYR